MALCSWRSFPRIVDGDVGLDAVVLFFQAEGMLPAVHDNAARGIDFTNGLVDAVDAILAVFRGGPLNGPVYPTTISSAVAAHHTITMTITARKIKPLRFPIRPPFLCRFRLIVVVCAFGFFNGGFAAGFRAARRRWLRCLFFRRGA
jgi:hypothetical protein